MAITPPIRKQQTETVSVECEGAETTKLLYLMSVKLFSIKMTEEYDDHASPVRTHYHSHVFLTEK